MHQIRYFLGGSESLNFRRAAEECHVSGPVLTRAIQKLEEELKQYLPRVSDEVSLCPKEKE
jgi:DNA-binding transcriptional LysR family regulator